MLIWEGEASHGAPPHDALPRDDSPPGRDGVTAIDHEGEEYDATQGVPPAIDLPPRIKGVGTTNLADAQARYAAGTPQLTSMSNYPRPILNESLRSIERR